MDIKALATSADAIAAMGAICEKNDINIV